MKRSKCKFFEVIYPSWENIPFPLPLFIAVLICAEKSAFQGSVMCLVLLFKKNTLSYLVCITSKGWNIHQIANFLRSESMFSIPLAILQFLIRGYKQSIQLQILNLSKFLVYLCARVIELSYTLNIKQTTAKCFIMIISTFLKWYSILPQSIVFY